MAGRPRTLLDFVRESVIVDVDSMDPAVAARHTHSEATPEAGCDAGTHQNLDRFCDMTSNYAIAYYHTLRPENAELLAESIKRARVSAEEPIEKYTHTMDNFTVLSAKRVSPYLTGRVHAQVLPRTAYDTQKSVENAERLIALFEAEGIPKSRVCINLPATGECLFAMQQLENKGIRTMATCVFSVPQAKAASQAGCMYIAPYFNELRVHFKPSLWTEYADPAKEHPMSSVIREIIRQYRITGSKTLVMPANILTSAEVVGLMSLKSDHLALSGDVLKQLASEIAPEEGPKPQHAELDLDAIVPEASTATYPEMGRMDYLGMEVSDLRDALFADSEVRRKMSDALRIFGEMEQKLMFLISDRGSATAA